jgi:hypothetical protein
MDVVDDDWGWRAGLAWHVPFDVTDDEEDGDIEAAVINAAVDVIERSTGTETHDAAIATVLVEKAMARFSSEDILTCRHADCAVPLNLWAGPILGASCERWECMGRLYDFIQCSRRFAHCGLCTDRPEHSGPFTIAVQSLRTGRVSTPVHDGCLWPERPPF